MTLPVVRRHGSQVSTDGRAGRTVDPFAGFDDIYRQLNQLLRSFDAAFDRAGWPAAGVDLEETDDAYVVELELPGVAREDVTLEWNDRELTAYGEVKRRERTGFLRKQTRRVGEFHHTVALPGDIDGERIEASLADGVLTIRAPKTRSARRRRIAIGAGPA